MDNNLLKEYYQKRGFSDGEAIAAVDAVQRLEGFLSLSGTDLAQATVDQIAAYALGIPAGQPDGREALLAMARYFYLIHANDVYVYFCLLFGGQGVMENIRGRLESMEGAERAGHILDWLPIPPLGTPPGELPEHTARLMERLEASLSPSECAQVLTGNNHDIPEENFLEERKRYEEAPSIDDYLHELHGRKVAELQQFCDEGKVWYEQIITQDVVDYVKSSQEILSAIRSGDKLYVTKIPFDTVRLLQETDSAMRKYHICHCPFVRESLRSGKPDISGNWCYCSAGFEKFGFEVIFGTPLDIRVLESPLFGHERCRYEILLPQSVMEKV